MKRDDRVTADFVRVHVVMEHMVVLKRTFLARERLFAELLCFVSLRASSDVWRVFAWLWRQLPESARDCPSEPAPPRPECW